MNTLKNSMKLIALCAVAVGGLAGCSIGQSEFTCSAGNENALCGSSSAIYKATNGELTENDKITVIRGEERIVVDAKNFSVGDVPVSIEDEEGNVTVITPEKVQRTHSDTGYTFSYDGAVVRSDAEVMRIWIAPWVDKEDDLNLSSLIYTDVEPKKWDVVATDDGDSRAGVIPHLIESDNEKNINQSKAVNNKKTVNNKKQGGEKR